MNILLIIIVAFVVVIIVSQFNNAFFSLIEELRLQNKKLKKYRNKLEKLTSKRTQELERVNKDLKGKNIHLNEIIKAQNTDLKSKMNHLKETQSQLVQSGKWLHWEFW